MPEQPKEGAIVHVEYLSNDPDRTKRFYRDVFGWKFQDMPEMNYSTWEGPTRPGGGLMKTPEGQTPSVLNYILAKDIDATLRRISAAGGAVLKLKQEIPNMGYWALFREPGGTVTALYQDMPRPRPAPARKPAARKPAARKAKGRKR